MRRRKEKRWKKPEPRVEEERTRTPELRWPPSSSSKRSLSLLEKKTRTLSSTFEETTNIQQHHENYKWCVWHATDFADGELKDELFCIRFTSVENCKAFMEIVQDVAESQGKKEETKEESDAAELLEKLSVEDSKTEKKEEKEVPIAGKDNEGVAEKVKEEENKD